MLFIQENSDGVMFKIFVQPKSSKNAIVGLHGDALKIKLTAPPVDGAANKMCIKYLSKCLGIPKSLIEIRSGHTGRTKQILLRYKNNNISKDEQEHLKQLIGSLIIS
ncbi:DUF167 domain-containing protein [Desulfonema magnum]|uniref:UPF0235 protein dnm_098070 n=1 Tax=Desulfonema magnum TaxID=45655 RepID=A0A975GVZ9_9BACT|nr:DUF167 domain-containing protein [Desulfonema magnum]QTA93703.1 DUF167 [Desulfonema magnum]